MLRQKTVLFLMVLLVPFFILPSFAEPVISVDFDKPEYQTGEILKISGSISEVTMPVVAMSVYDPNGQILSANNLEIDEENSFSKSITLEAPFYEEPGQYTVKFDYTQVSQEENFVIEGDFDDFEISLDDLLAPEILLLSTDKPIYTDNDVITVTGTVTSVESPSVLVGVYDTFGTPAGFYFGELDSNMEFSINFLAKADVNFKQDGTYSIQAHYADSEETVFFDFYKDMGEIFDEPSDNQKDKETKNEKQNTEDNSKSETSNKDKSKETTNKSNQSIIKNEKQNKSSSNQDSILQTEKESTRNTQTEKQPNFRKTKNLSVDDIELGIMLNQINLDCDHSTYIDTISYYDGMGPALYRLCKFSNSVAVFDETLAKDPNNVEVLTNKGSALGKLGYRSEAIHQYDLALEIDPKFVPAINNKANMLATMGYPDEAISLYLDALEINPHYTTAKKNFAIVLSQLPVEEDFESTTQSVEQFNEINKISEIPPPPPEPTKEPEKESNFLEVISSVFSSFFNMFE